MGKILETSEGRYERVSRWITVRTKEITEKSPFQCYAQDREGFLDYIIHKGLMLPVGAFYLIGTMFISGNQPEFTEKGEKHRICSVYMDGDIYNPYYAELDECGERMRLYKKA